MKFYIAFVSTTADLFTNLSAGWIGTAFISPIFRPKRQQINNSLLILNLLLSILSFVIALISRSIII